MSAHRSYRAARRWGIAIAVLLATASTAGCGQDESSDPETTTTTTVTESAASPVDPAQGDVSSLELPEQAPAEQIVVPNVVGMNHQLAQDTMQAAGFYFLSEVDGSGAGRMLLLDRNWTTIEQDPPAGSAVGPDSEITLTAVKDGD